jgi:hypothetical protein
MSGKKLKQAMDNYHHFSPGTTKKIKSRPSSEPPDDMNTVDDGSTRWHVRSVRVSVKIEQKKFHV